MEQFKYKHERRGAVGGSEKASPAQPCSTPIATRKSNRARSASATRQIVGLRMFMQDKRTGLKVRLTVTSSPSEGAQPAAKGPDAD